MSKRHRELDGKRVLITGGSSGIGLATAHRLAEAGARLALMARGDEGLARAREDVRAGVATIAADVRDAGQVRAGVDEAAQALGGLDAVVANAGAGAYGPFMDMDVDDYQQVIAITMLGMINTAHAALPHLTASRGTLVVIGSVAGRLPTPWLSAYAAAKHGVRGFVRSLDCELRAQHVPVRLALVAPGPVDTPFWARARTPDSRLPPKIVGAYRPGDVAAAVERALESPGRLERAVGGLFAPAVFIDALAPNLVLRPLGVAARLGWRRRQAQPRSGEDALAQPADSAEASGGLASRPSVLTALRDRAPGRRG